MIAALLDHIWQSTLFAGGIALLTFFFRRNRASLRFWLWFTASAKFLVPFAGLAALGGYLSHLFPTPLPSSILAIQPAAEKLSAPAHMLVASHAQGQAIGLAPLLLAGWLAGFAAIFGLRLLHWVRLRKLTDTAQDFPMPDFPQDLSMSAPVRITPSLMEPGLVGIFRPVVMLPDGLMGFLSGPERASILAHELTHLRRRDNVTAVIHMAVETLFWFAPPVWLIGARLIEERERACDESVLALGHDPEVYAGGIIKVCKFCIQSPLACASGVSGADLGNRVRQIMSGEALLGLTPAKRLLLAGTAALALTLPVMAGFANSPLIVQVERQVVAVQARAQEAITAMTQQMASAAPAIEEVAVIPQLKTLKAPAAAAPTFQIAPASQADAAPDIAPPAQAQPAAASPKIQPELPAAAPVPASGAAALKNALRAISPTGEGDPDAVTCRVPQQLPGSRLAGPEICKVNRIWAKLRADGKDISADGAYLVTTLSPTHAQPALGSGCHIIAPVPALLGGANLPDPPAQSACR